MAATTRQLVTMADAADALAVSIRTVRRYVAAGQLDAVRLGRKILRIKVESIERLVDEHSVDIWKRPGVNSGTCGDRSQYNRLMVTPTLKATVDQLSDAERRDLLHYLEQTIEDDFALTDEQVAELERRDAELVSGALEPLTVDDLMQRVQARIQ